MIIVVEFVKEWGVIKYRYLKCGYIYYKKIIVLVVIDEQFGLVVEYLEVFCVIDVWYIGVGFVGLQKGVSVFEYYKIKGLIIRFYQLV